MARMGLGKATAYRYLGALTDAGILTSDSGGRYVLGPRIIEMDRLIRTGDRLLRSGSDVMKTLREAVNGSQLLCRFYGDRVLSIHEERTDNDIHSPYERGLPFPLFRGAPSRIILAHLPAYQAKNLFLSHTEEVRAAGLGDNWAAFNDRMKQIRRDGYYIGSEIDPALVGVAAPIFAEDGKVVGCLCLVHVKAKTTPEEIARLVELAKSGAARISADLAA